jgi:hypothetical protein
VIPRTTQTALAPDTSARRLQNREAKQSVVRGPRPMVSRQLFINQTPGMPARGRPLYAALGFLVFSGSCCTMVSRSHNSVWAPRYNEPH